MSASPDNESEECFKFAIELAEADLTHAAVDCFELTGLREVGLVILDDGAIRFCLPKGCGGILEAPDLADAAVDYFGLFPGLRELKIVARDDGAVKVVRG